MLATYFKSQLPGKIDLSSNYLHAYLSVLLETKAEQYSVLWNAWALFYPVFVNGTEFCITAVLKCFDSQSVSTRPDSSRLSTCSVSYSMGICIGCEKAKHCRIPKTP